MAVESSFLGRGWSFPPAFTRGGSGVETVQDAEDIQQSLQLILSTRPGERFGREDFGCDVAGLAFEHADETAAAELRRRISDSILYHEPRIDIDRLEVEPGDPGVGELRVDLAYTVRGTNSRYNFVFPFYLKEATHPEL